MHFHVFLFFSCFVSIEFYLCGFCARIWAKPKYNQYFQDILYYSGVSNLHTKIVTNGHHYKMNKKLNGNLHTSWHNWTLQYNNLVYLHNDSGSGRRAYAMLTSKTVTIVCVIKGQEAKKWSLAPCLLKRSKKISWKREWTIFFTFFSLNYDFSWRQL